MHYRKCTVKAISAIGASLAVLWPSHLSAQVQQYGSQGTAADQKPHTPPDLKKWKKAEVLQQAPDLPYLPKYPGHAVYDHSEAQRPNATSPRPTAYNLRYKVREDPDYVLDWYDTAFKEHGWTLMGTKTKLPKYRKGRLTAVRKEEGITCTVLVKPSSSPGYITDLSLRYFNTPVVKLTRLPSPAKLPGQLGKATGAPPITKPGSQSVNQPGRPSSQQPPGSR